jgi:NAD(P)-dependent dehydrogenase (short-subunit alcohol dehydrogenase family)
MVGQLVDKVVLVTGASSGIGRVSALTFAKEGARVVLGDVDFSGGNETARMIKEAGGNAIFVKVDVAKAAEVEALINKAVATYGRLDCAFNNAGTAFKGSTVECTEEHWDRTIDINLKGVWFCMKFEIPEMVKRGGGAIVNTASVYGLVGAENRMAYVVSKHGVVGLTRAAATEYASSNVRINAICPGHIRTPLFERALEWEGQQYQRELIARYPIGRLGTPEEVAEAAIWLLSDAASFVTGLIMAVDGGYTAK